MVVIVWVVILACVWHEVVRPAVLMVVRTLGMLVHLASSTVLPFAATTARRAPLHGRGRMRIVKRRAEATVPDLASQRTRFFPAT